MPSNQKSFFWVSYADLMTSLFFVMLVLFILAVAVLNERRQAAVQKEQDAVEKTQELERKILKADEISNATKELDPIYFEYIPKYKKHKLTVAVHFRKGSASLDDMPQKTLNELNYAGRELRRFVIHTTIKYPEIQYLLIIEGQASWDRYKYNYRLSYERALALKSYWDRAGISFNTRNCEVLICGSGDGQLSGTGLMREAKESLNQRFLIHIVPKPGKIGDSSPGGNQGATAAQQSKTNNDAAQIESSNSQEQTLIAIRVNAKEKGIRLWVVLGLGTFVLVIAGIGLLAALRNKRN